MAAQEIRPRVWRNGALEAENFPFEQVSDYLAEPDCLVWADLVNPDEQTLCRLADELSLDQHAVEDGCRPSAPSRASSPSGWTTRSMNMVMKKLTSWAATIAVPTAVTGCFGQNVPYPGFGREWGFLSGIVVIVLIAGALYVPFRRKDWL